MIIRGRLRRHFNADGTAKAAFATEAEAYAHAESRKESKLTVRAYPCTLGPKGPHWHWGHK